MDPVSFCFRYMWWHYVYAWRDISRVCINLLWGVWRLFSIPELAINLLTPFERLDERPKTFLPQDIGSAFLVSTIMRAVGVAIRAPVILIGLAFLIVVLVMWACLMMSWIFLPLFIPAIGIIGLAKILGIL